jgi:hypothetical protein
VPDEKKGFFALKEVEYLNMNLTWRPKWSANWAIQAETGYTI